MPRGRLLPTPPLLLTVVLTGLLTGLLTGCAGAGSSDQSSAGSPAEAPVDAEASGSLGEDRGETGDPAAAGRAAAVQRAVVSTGDVHLRARDVARARAEVVRLTAGWGGSVADEQSSSDRDGRPESTTMTLRVPSDRFSAAMDALGQVAELRSQSRTVEDVTTEVVDVDARVRVQESSVRRIKALLERATSVRDVISIESDLATRQADLDSLRSQQAYLSDQTTLSTITVLLDRRATTDPGGDDAGFLVGLRGGLSALGGSATALATAAGATLPFVVLAAVLLAPALAVRRVVRRRRVGA